jgi:hypothetical protein
MNFYVYMLNSKSIKKVTYGGYTKKNINQKKKQFLENII